MILGAITGDTIGSAYEFNNTKDFEDAMRKAVSMGGDSDTLASITGGIAEAYYGQLPPHIREEVISRLPKEFCEVLEKF